MKTRKVVVLPYDVAWQSAFEKIKGEIEEAIGDLIVGIEHVGSTSVEGMSAKPCIDIDVVIEDYSAFSAVVDGLKAIGYIHINIYTRFGRHSFDRGASDMFNADD